MGMTDDFEVAVEEGATIVRVGRALFGERSHDHDAAGPRPATDRTGRADVAGGRAASPVAESAVRATRTRLVDSTSC